MNKKYMSRATNKEVLSLSIKETIHSNISDTDKLSAFKNLELSDNQKEMLGLFLIKNNYKNLFLCKNGENLFGKNKNFSNFLEISVKYKQDKIAIDLLKNCEYCSDKLYSSLVNTIKNKNNNQFSLILENHKSSDILELSFKNNLLMRQSLKYQNFFAIEYLIYNGNTYFERKKDIWKHVVNNPKRLEYLFDPNKSLIKFEYFPLYYFSNWATDINHSDGIKQYELACYVMKYAGSYGNKKENIRAIQKEINQYNYPDLGINMKTNIKKHINFLFSVWLEAKLSLPTVSKKIHKI